MSDDKNNLLRQIPQVNELLKYYDPPLGLTTQAIREVLDQLRRNILEGRVTALPGLLELFEEIDSKIKSYTTLNLRRIVNGTGIILHTNLGRAPLAYEARDAAYNVAMGYYNLEYDVETGKRSSRHVHVEGLLTQLTGAETAMVVNNNAAAVLLALSAVAQKDVIVSRGELVEIGGSFRVPDVLVQSGCRLVEVGTTNKTHTWDYENAIEPGQTGAILRVHTSNFVIKGFVAKPSLAELAHIAHQHNIPLIEDLGSGCLIPLSRYGIHGQPLVSDSIKAGADIVTLSGDKLLGGPQAGIIVGRAEYIVKMKAHPLARALRIDKLCLAALEATLRLYLDPRNAVERIPTLNMLCETQEALLRKAVQLKSQLDPVPPCCDSPDCIRRNTTITIIQEASQAGGGAMPEEDIVSAAVVIATNISAQALERYFRKWKTPIIGRVSHDRFILDVRTIEYHEFAIIAAALNKICEGKT